MKLRNKKTGDIVSLSLYGISLNTRSEEQPTYHSIEQLCEDWEDYKPAEPLIKDEKIRKAVRAWWETLPAAMTDKRVLYKENQDLAVGVYSIYCGAIYPETLEKGKMYSIAELCGEEEKPRAVIADGVEYSSYEDCLKSKEAENAKD